MLINKRENAGLKHFNDSKAFINEKCETLIVFDDIITGMLSNKKT